MHLQRPLSRMSVFVLLVESQFGVLTRGWETAGCTIGINVADVDVVDVVVVVLGDVDMEVVVKSPIELVTADMGTCRVMIATAKLVDTVLNVLLDDFSKNEDDEADKAWGPVEPRTRPLLLTLGIALKVEVVMAIAGPVHTGFVETRVVI